MSINNQTLEAKIEELQVMEAYIEELNEECKEIKRMISNEMDSLGVTEAQIGRFNVKYFSVITNKLDVTKFKKECSSIYSAYLKATESKRLKIA